MPHDWSLAQQIDRVLSGLEPELASHVTAETHKSALELATGVHETVASATAELHSLRAELDHSCRCWGSPPRAPAPTPSRSGKRPSSRAGAATKRSMARCASLPGVSRPSGCTSTSACRDPEAAIELANSMRGHLPLLLALSANSPFWQGRDTGLASARTPLFQAFPRVGIPRAFASYADYVSTVDLLIRCGAFPEPTFLWWDVRPQPRFGTVEVRIMDAQTTICDTAALAALVQSIARLEVEQGYLPPVSSTPEALDENRFLAARDGVAAELIDVDAERRIPVPEQLEPLLAACTPTRVSSGAPPSSSTSTRWRPRRGPGASSNLRDTPRERLAGLVRELAAQFLDDGLSGSPASAALDQRRLPDFAQTRGNAAVMRKMRPDRWEKRRA